jgi:SRSO17 transposase
MIFWAAAGPSVDPGRWLGILDELMTRTGSRFRRVEPRHRARAFALGLLAQLPRVNCWTLAEHAGDVSPDGMRHLLARAKRDADGVRDGVRAFAVEHLGDPGAVLVVDETGDLKKGTATAGVQRQYTGTAGRIENAQVAVYLGYAAPTGHALIDRELYLPKSWTADPGRCAAAGIPENTAFATKPQLAQQMIERAVTAGVPFGWVAGDEVYGGNGPLRGWLEDQDTAYVLAVACHHRVPAGAGRTLRADELAARLPRRAWQRLAAGDGAKGHRYYDWAWVAVPGPGHRHLLIRRNRATGELAFYRCYSPRQVTLAALVKVAGLRWTIEENFQAGKALTGMDEHQVRRWTSWRRWVTLAMLAAAVLTIAAATEHARTPESDGQIPLTRNEIAHLLATTIIQPAHDSAHRLHWSRWRRRHQHRARTCHYRRQAAQDQTT